MQGAPEVKLFPTPTYLRKASEFWKMVKNVLNQLAEDLLRLIFSLPGGRNRMQLKNFKQQVGS